jgi:hypothetical protein
MYKLEVYFFKNPNFVYGNPTNTKTSGQYEENEIGSNGIPQEGEV